MVDLLIHFNVQPTHKFQIDLLINKHYLLITTQFDTKFGTDPNEYFFSMVLPWDLFIGSHDRLRAADWFGMPEAKTSEGNLAIISSAAADGAFLCSEASFLFEGRT